jgi:DNA-binding protein HU-beta
MTKAEFIEQVIQSAGVELSKKDVAGVLDTVFSVIGKTIKDKNRFSYPGFGTFTVKERSARKGRNPRTGAAINIKASKTVGFKPAPSLKQNLAAPSRRRK